MNFLHLDMKKYKQGDKENLHKQVQNFFGTYEPIADFEMIKIGYNIVKALKIDKNVKIKINSLRKYGNKK